MANQSLGDAVDEKQPGPILNFGGEKVALGPLRRDLAELYQKWNNDFVVSRATSQIRPVTLAEQEESIERLSKERSIVFFTIYELVTKRPIGFTYLADMKKGNAEFAILIGERDCHGRGYGTETTRLMLDYAFTVLGLHNVMLKVTAFNAAGIGAYQKAGFREIGRRREAVWLNGRYWDMIYMDCLAAEFRGTTLSQLLTPDEPANP